MDSAEAWRPSRRWWLHLLLFFLTFITTTAFGYALAGSFAAGRPLSDIFVETSYRRLLFGDHAIWAGTLYSIPVLLILVAHEMGHYVACRRWRVEATLPYFLPSPTLLGTLGAFIRIPSPIYNRRSLFDIGVSGPIAGFVVLLPFLMSGIWLSKVAPGMGATGAFAFGTPLLMRIFEWIRFPGVAPQNISLHPIAMAAWAGLLATSINLLPAGQLDGGHILYALGGENAHKVVSRVVVVGLALLGFLYWPWWIWAVLMFFFRRHPLVYDEACLGQKRFVIGAFALGLLLISVAVVPVEIR
ncbi:MAG TPA: site-2 protease family protein [Bryobacteraceae bacterium]|nr:site-2 protease family protein [Bryobacteraceae bacterium]